MKSQKGRKGKEETNIPVVLVSPREDGSHLQVVQLHTGTWTRPRLGSFRHLALLVPFKCSFPPPCGFSNRSGAPHPLPAPPCGPMSLFTPPHAPLLFHPGCRSESLANGVRVLLLLVQVGGIIVILPMYTVEYFVPDLRPPARRLAPPRVVLASHHPSLVPFIGALAYQVHLLSNVSQTLCLSLSLEPFFPFFPGPCSAPPVRPTSVGFSFYFGGFSHVLCCVFLYELPRPTGLPPSC